MAGPSEAHDARAVCDNAILTPVLTGNSKRQTVCSESTDSRSSVLFAEIAVACTIATDVTRPQPRRSERTPISDNFEQGQAVNLAGRYSN
jgi:hypothetical protein